MIRACRNQHIRMVDLGTSREMYESGSEMGKKKVIETKFTTQWRKEQWTHSQQRPALWPCWDNKHCRKEKGGEIYRREETCDINILRSTRPTPVVELVSVSFNAYKTEKVSTTIVGQVFFKIFVSQVPILTNSAPAERAPSSLPLRGRGREGRWRRGSGRRALYE